MVRSIYLDNNASTPIDPRVLQLVALYSQEVFGNPSSVHHFGQEAKKLLVKSRDQIASCLGVKSEEIIFTSGGTEAANLVIYGLLGMAPGSHIITSSVEHSCVYNTVKVFEKKGHQATFISPGLWGAALPEEVKKAIQPHTKLIALMGANNETGVKTDIEAIASIASEAGIPFFVDGVAMLGKGPLVIPEGVSAMGFSGQKIHAPKGVGFCFIRRKLKMVPHLTGGDQEQGRRAGTENLPSIAGLAEAVSLCFENQDETLARMERLRDKFEAALKKELAAIAVNGEAPRIVNTSNLSFGGVDGETLLTVLDRQGIAASHGSACASGALEPSRVLLNMGLGLDRVNSSLRFSLSRFTTENEIDQACETIVQTVRKLQR